MVDFCRYIWKKSWKKYAITTPRIPTRTCGNWSQSIDITRIQSRLNLLPQTDCNLMIRFIYLFYKVYVWVVKYNKEVCNNSFSFESKIFITFSATHYIDLLLKTTVLVIQQTGNLTRSHQCYLPVWERENLLWYRIIRMSSKMFLVERKRFLFSWNFLFFQLVCNMKINNVA